MNKRDLIKEITDRRARRNDTARVSGVLDRVQLLAEAAAFTLAPLEHERIRNEFLRYVPVALVACMEVYFRSAIQDLIDSGDKYRKRIDKLGKIEFRLDSVLAIHGRTVTVGEFVAHNLRISNLAHIDEHLTNLLGDKFLPQLKVRERMMSNLIMSLTWKEYVTCLERIFVMRHVFCHEVADEPLVTIDVVNLQIGCVWDFVTCTESLITEWIGEDANRKRGLMHKAREAVVRGKRS